jgi:hypothetical protein
MPRPHASTTTTLKASAQSVYAILADYRDAHPRILPPVFRNLTVERGGIGDGTVIRYEMRVWGSTQQVRAEITEPEPGRVLVEKDEVTGAVTTFTVDPEGSNARVTIATEWNRPGLRGWIEAKIAPGMLRKIYAEELNNLERLASARSG